MKVTLSSGKTIEVQEPSEIHQLEYLKMVEQGRSDELTNEELIKMQDQHIMSLTDLSEQDLLEMPLVDKSKIKKAIMSRYVIVGPCSDQQDF